MNKHEKIECRRFFKEIVDEVMMATKLTVGGLLYLYINREQLIKELTEMITRLAKEEGPEKNLV